MNPLTKKKAVWYAKLGFTAALLVFILYHVDWRALFNSMAMVRNELLILWLLLVIMNTGLSALKWRVLLKPFGVGLSLMSAIRLYFITLFFNSFLPGSIGGDGYRGYQVYKLDGRLSAAYVPIFMERVSGLIVLVFMGGVAGTYLYLVRQDFVSLVIALAGLGAAAAIMFFFSLVIFREKILSLKIVKDKKHIHALASKFFRNVIIYKGHPRGVLWAAVITVFFYLILFYARFLLVMATGSYVPFIAVIGVIMVSNVLAMLPVSINGYGILDLSFIGLLSYYGVDYEKAVLVMLLYRGMQVLVSSFGGILYAFSGQGSVGKTKDNKQEDVAAGRSGSKNLRYTLAK
jgi:uncharacterized protein (TIRG00374 family)